ncbi:MAG: hypothetical protein IPG93_03510 [Burkholderiales bacterium]|nr:hypothetical protein [Burkholderiales bacterium]
MVNILNATLLPPDSCVDYRSLAEELSCNGLPAPRSDFLNRLSTAWIAAYRKQSGRLTNITEMWSNEFAFLVDLEGADHGDGRGQQPPGVYMRTFAAYGLSRTAEGDRGVDDRRLRGWMGKTGEAFGSERDKGHFIAHSVGGAVIAGETNVFPQRRDLNRGWSDAGKRYRLLERTAQLNPGAFFFHRAIYLHESTTPDFLEVGLCLMGQPLRVEIFDNRV